MPSCCSSLSSRLKGTPVPYFIRATMATAVASYLSGPAVAGASAVNICPQALQRSRSISNTVASSGACPTNLTSVAGSFWRYTFPRRHSGQRSPVCNVACATATVTTGDEGSSDQSARVEVGVATLGADALFSGWLAGAASSGRMALLFSVLRFGISLSAMACSAVLSCWPSEALSGARVLRSIISSSSSRFTSIRRLLFIAG